MDKIKILAITGPTASGKTRAAIYLAQKLSGEIISLDSMQIYRGMDIGTAKATPGERAAVPHHMIDILSPDIPYSAYQYKEAAIAAAEDIAKRGRLPIFAGGTGLYLDTLVRHDSVYVPEADEEFRRQLTEATVTEEDRIALHARLSELDPESGEKIHYNNLKRVIRAIEICEKTGIPKSRIDRMKSLPDEHFDLCHITFDFHSRELLYERIDRRVDEMFALGLVDEVKSLMESGAFTEGCTAASAIGYKEIIEAVRLGLPPECAAEKIKQASRNYAKRQITWFRHNTGVHPVYCDTEDGVIRESEQILSECESIARSFLQNNN